MPRWSNEQFSSPKIGEMLGELPNDLVKDRESDEAVNIRADLGGGGNLNGGCGVLNSRIFVVKGNRAWENLRA